jgi:hypothetical protein
MNDDPETGSVRAAYLDAAASAATLIGDPAVAAGWAAPSALAKLSVGGLATHLARQVLRVPGLLAAEVPDQPPISLLDHYARSEWVGADLDHESNVTIRDTSDREAAEGAAALLARTGAAVDAVRVALPAEPADRVVHLPWGPWSLSLDDFLVTRMMEIAVHNDDLAVSVGRPAPPLPARVLDPVLSLLSQLAVRRHGATAVLRALSRAERAPATITAF